MVAELRADEPFDVLVIGGGITGVGVALDAAARGLRTALVERDDFASGTSSKSSKMVHGGLRYLQNGDVRLVYEALRERRRLMQNAPHLVDVLPFMIPIMTQRQRGVQEDSRGPWGRRCGCTTSPAVGASASSTSGSTRDKQPNTSPRPTLDKLSSGYLYYDAGADDARLVVTLARTAAQRGAVLANRCGVVGRHDRRTAARPTVRSSKPTATSSQSVPASSINAAGVWADDVRALDEGANPDSIRPAKGVHLTIPWEKVRNDIAVIIPVRSDKRSLFLVPWGPQADGSYSHCYVGTTDTDHDGGLDEHQTTAVDIDYVLTALNDALETTITLADVTGVWSGLRPLVKANAGDEPMGKTADLSRQHQVAVSDSGVVRVSGGKLTTYRKMAEDTVEIAMQQLGRRRRASRKQSTKRLKLIGARGHRSTQPGTQVGHLARRYGSLAAEVKALIAFEPALGEPIAPGHQYVLAEVVYAARHEMATTLSDVLERRTRLHIFDREAALTAAPRVAALMATELHWDMAETEHQLDNYRQLCAAEEAAARDQLAAHITD